jgi:predicted DNA-binding protein (UPF0278 family)
MYSWRALLTAPVSMRRRCTSERARADRLGHRSRPARYPIRQVARLGDAYLKAVRQRATHPGDVTEQAITQAATALRDAYTAEQKDIAKAERARALDYATIALNRPRRRA